MNIISKILVIIMSLYSIYLGYFDAISHDYYHMLICLSLIVILFLPKIMEKIFKIKISNLNKNIFILFIFVALFLGSIVNLYDKIYWFDTFTHFLFGFLSCFFVLEFLFIIKKYDYKNKFFNILFILSMIFMLASLWEYFEFISDNISHADAQKVLETGVNDTMKDMIVATIGSIIFIFYYLKYSTKLEKIIEKNN